MLYSTVLNLSLRQLLTCSSLSSNRLPFCGMGMTVSLYGSSIKDPGLLLFALCRQFNTSKTTTIAMTANAAADIKPIASGGSELKLSLCLTTFSQSCQLVQVLFHLAGSAFGSLGTFRGEVPFDDISLSTVPCSRRC